MKTQNEFPGSISLPFGIKTSHTWHEIGQLLRIINDLDVETFVEIGVHVGGLASMISSVAHYKPFVYQGVEIAEALIDDRIKPLVFCGDALSPVTRHYVSTVSGVGKGTKFIYCDGGDKIGEMRFYWELLNTGDMIACHDYFDGQKVFGMDGFGFDDGKCGCKPEVWRESLDFLFDNPAFEEMDHYLLEGTRIMGFVKIS